MLTGKRANDTKKAVAFYSGEVDRICRWSVVIGKVSDPDLDGFIANIDAIGEATTPGYVVLDIAHGISMPTPLQRQRVAEAVASATKRTRVLTAHALATNSATARGVLTAVNWFIKRTFDEKVFPVPRDALEWLATLSQRVDPEAVLSDIARKVPPFGTLRW